MSKQGVLSYRIEEEPTSRNLTALSGLAPYLDQASASGLVGSIHKNLCVRDGGQGWTDVQIVMSLVLLNLAGGDCVDDLEQLNADAGFGKLLLWCENQGLPSRMLFSATSTSVLISPLTYPGSAGWCVGKPADESCSLPSHLRSRQDR